MKKSLLAGCIALATAGAQAELSPMSEFELHNVTGQAGVDIELDVGLSIEEIRYTDTEFEGDGDGGSLSVKNITIGGANKSSFFQTPNIVPNASNSLDEVIFSIDIASDGDLVISGNPKNGNFIDFSLTTGAIATLDSNGDEAARLVDSVSMVGLAAGLLMKVESTGNKVILAADIAIEDMDIDASSIGFQLENVTVAGENYLQEVDVFGKAKPLSWAFPVGMIITPENTGVDIELLPSVMDIQVEKLSVGGDHVGALRIDDFALNDVSLFVKGHN
ncbi:hypothetical protein SAMN05421686_11218 [Thalassolituus maritimus]|uniref:DUF6160 domain-containing protein n=1 Tax=Thalassolituus maritimus TaxID=484498 RepID=A0A1N7PXY2_9GAMM|nr:DUF6160 family protein [Thalassolituus maritimus]SIT15440.1 hypothetical protein SAMN05421686_11218 [Thalassolituus maritimus]